MAWGVLSITVICSVPIKATSDVATTQKMRKQIMTQFFAQPYDISATGFYFETVEEYQKNAKNHQNAYGQFVEEYEIQFIDGEELDCALCQAWNIHQGNFADFIDASENWDHTDKLIFIIAVGECGYAFDPQNVSAHNFEVDIYYVDSLKQLAEQFVEEGLFGDIPANIQAYLDYDRIARDLEVEYSIIDIAGERMAYRCW